MTKTQLLYYFAAVIVITLLAYLYTTVVQAPTHDSVIDSSSGSA